MKFTMPPAPKTLISQQLRQARRCYGHAAGVFGCALCDALLAGGYLLPIEQKFLLSAKGRSLFSNWGIDCVTLEKNRAAFAPQCLDGSERRLHLGGSLGRAVLEAFVARGWVELQTGSRSLRVSEAGWETLRKL